MSRKVVLAASVALMMSHAGCKKEASEASSTEPSDKAVLAAVTPVPEAPEKPELAPAGVFYVITPARVETADGVVGLKPGTGVKQTRPGYYLTPYGEIALNANQVTNDMALARRVARAESAQQDQLKKAGEARAREAQARAATAAGGQSPTTAAVLPTPTPVPGAPRLPATPAVSIESKSSLNQNGPIAGSRMSSGGLGAKRAGNDGKIYVDSQGKKFWKDENGRPRYDF